MDMLAAEQFAAEYAKSFTRTAAFMRKTRGLDYLAAEEFAQCAWVRAWEKRDQWRGGNLFAWVVTICVRLHLIQLRRKPSFSLDEGRDNRVDQFSFEQLDAAMDQVTVMKSCAPSHREALERKYVDEKEHMSNTERTQVRRAVLAVRKSLSMAVGA